MNLNEYIEKLLEFQKQGYGEFPLIYSSDEEGNSFHTAYFPPSVCQVRDINDYNIELLEKITKPNCIIIN